jgi:aspartate kinase
MNSDSQPMSKSRRAIAARRICSKAPELCSEHLTQHRPRRQLRQGTRKPLLVMKFGGTSVGDACAIRKVVDIIRAASHENNVVVVVSAMSGVTNQLLDAAARSEAGDSESVAGIFASLSRQHSLTAKALIQSPDRLSFVTGKFRQLLEEGDHLCRNAILRREMTLQVRDSICSLGERLSAPLLAGTLAEHGVESEAIEATELVVTDSCHGSAEPHMEATRQRCQTLLHPILRRSVVPVVTGFIGASVDGVITTLGRGGSDYSATILGACLEADEIIIWTDVDGVLTADPRLVPDARTIPEISYGQATELAHFGAKVLHAKTLQPVTRSEIPVWIRNTFAPEKSGTKITSTGVPDEGEVMALSAMTNVALITVQGSKGVKDLRARTFEIAVGVSTHILLFSQSSSPNNVRFIVSSAVANRTLEALRCEFAQHQTHEMLDRVNIDPAVAVVTLVGRNVLGMSGIIERSTDALKRNNINLITDAQGASSYNASFVVPLKEMKTTVEIIHQELQLDNPHRAALSAKTA